MSAPQTDDELVASITQLMGGLSPEGRARVAKLKLWTFGYQMEATLPGLVSAVLALTKGDSPDDRQRRGALLEEVAVVLFAGVYAVPASGIESWRGPMGQHDLLVRASDTLGGADLKEALFGHRFDLLIEAKATKGKVDVGIMHKLCGSLSGHFQSTASIGIFLALEGITGGGKRTTAEAQLVRMLFYARTQKPIIVIDKNDLKRLAGGENLLGMMKVKLQQLESGRIDDPGYTSIPLPQNLKAAFDQCGICSRT